MFESVVSGLAVATIATFVLVIAFWSIEVGRYCLGRRGYPSSTTSRITGFAILAFGALLIALVFVAIAAYFLGGISLG